VKAETEQPKRLFSTSKFIISWAIATTLSTFLVISIPRVTPLSQALSGNYFAWFPPSFISLSDITLRLFSEIITGVVIGIFQWVIIRQYLYRSTLWIFATFIGHLIRFLFIRYFILNFYHFTVNSPLSKMIEHLTGGPFYAETNRFFSIQEQLLFGVCLSTLIGLIIGCIQWGLYLRLIHNSQIWIFISIWSFVIGVIFEQFLGLWSSWIFSALITGWGFSLILRIELAKVYESELMEREDMVNPPSL